ncbi:MAG TPA: hypothetical protein VJ719_13285 [Chthoniobacterales bacterium]|nr:hypothetical protein [Chthoniobacterales bacterium]
MSFRNSFYLGVIIAVTLGLFLVRLWQPEQQVRKHSEHLLASITDKDWDNFEELIAEDYQDQWGHDRTAVVQRTRQVARYARGLRISVIAPNVRIENRTGYWRAFVSIDGDKDNEVIAAMKERVNTLQTPFELKWQRKSGKPWDWKLISVGNAGLELPRLDY